MTQQFEEARRVSDANTSVSEGYSIEVARETIGVVVRAPGERHFTFITAVKAFSALDGHQFRGPLEAERAARVHLAQRRHNMKTVRKVSRPPTPAGEQCVWTAPSDIRAGEFQFT